MPLSDELRTISARLCLSDTTQVEGRTLLALAERVATLESERSDIAEQAQEIILALNDPVTGLAKLTATLERLNARPARPVDSPATVPVPPLPIVPQNYPER